jgi:hypothetical protein
MVKFNKFHVTNGAAKARVFYSLDNRCDGRACVTLYARDYDRALGAILPDAYDNRTDYQSDYFDKGHVDLFADHPHYAAARARAEQIIAERAAKAAARGRA